MKPSVARLFDRREFVKRVGAAAAGLGAASAGAASVGAASVGASGFVTHDDLDAITQHVRTASKPSELKITDLRVAVIVKAPMTCPIIRIETNQGLTGYGEVRDGASETYALVLKSRLLGENP